MPFVEKQRCKTAHVLLSKACPPHNVPHKICECPLSFDRNPVWLLYPASHYRENLDCLTVVQLQESARCVDQFPPRLKESVIDCLLDDFLKFRSQFLSYNLGDIDRYPATNNRNVRLLILADIFELRYGATVAAAFRYALRSESVQSHQCNLPELPSSLTWISSEKQLLVNLMSKFSKAELLSVLRKIPSRVRPPYKRTIKSCSFAITDLIIAQALFLLQLSSSDFILEFASLLPSSITLPYVENRELQIIEILKLEFGETVVREIGMQPHCKNQSRKEKRYATRIEKIKNDRIYSQSLVENWPQKIDEKVIFQSLVDFCKGSIWEHPKICSVCGLERHGVENIEISHIGELPLFLDILHVSEPAIIRESDFVYENERLNGLILDKDGFEQSTADSDLLQICHKCYRSLKLKRMPKFALANGLYRGRLPDCLQDLTWVEEMVCAKYRNTAHVTRLYQSDDPANPRLFHGNTCAHEMNIVSTASVLPRTPSDINDLLSVIFIGPEKFKPENTGNLFRVRKSKIAAFLGFLKINNQLYKDMKIDPVLFDLFPEDGPLPGIEARVIHDSTLNCNRVFLEETAGFTEHPAQYLKSSDTGVPTILLEKTGVSDPEGIKCNGRTLTASALRKLAPAQTNVPDLVIHHSHNAIPEYNNPDLILGMFPSLFPFGIAGFEDPKRTVKISFQAHANALLDVPDHSFRRHHTFMFVILNIIQRRTGHLQTHFTVQNSQFDDVAQKITSISSESLQSLANYLECEGKINKLNEEQKCAMLLLDKVNTISAHVPGSQASKIFIRNEIRSYFNEFGLPQIFFTFNPSAVHSPVFQAMYGDMTVDITD